MSYKIDIEPRTFHFKQPAGTSRGIYTTRQSWFLTVTDTERPGVSGVAFAIAAILMILTMLINFAAVLVGKYFKKRKDM